MADLLRRAVQDKVRIKCVPAHARHTSSERFLAVMSAPQTRQVQLDSEGHEAVVAGVLA